jgi:hypothetical protein
VIYDDGTNVGVGTTSVSATYGKLTVAGGIRTTDDTSSKLELGRYSAGAPNSYIKLGANSASLRVTNAADDTDLMTLTNAGNLGVGTSSPSYLLECSNSADTVVSAAITNASTGTSAQTRLRLNNSTGNFGTLTHTGGSFTSSGVFRQDGTYLFGNGAGGVSLITGAATPIVFATNSTERMRIDSSGNVGVGTTAPSQRVSVGASSGTIGYGIEYTPTDQQVFALTANLATGEVRHFADTNYFPTFYANNAERMRIDTSGNVGIGTSAPAAKLQVIGSVFSQIAVDGSNASGVRLVPAGSGEQFVRFVTSDGSNRAAISGQDDGGGPGSMRFYTANSLAAMTQRMLIDSSGNVGIGTSSPATRLTVSDGAITAGAVSDVLIGRYSSTFPTSGAGYFRIRTNNTDAVNGGISVDTLASGTLTERLTITGAGNVSVGNSALPYTTSGRTVFNVNGTSSTIMSLQTAGSNRGYLYADGSLVALETESGVTLRLLTNAAQPITFFTNGAERGRFDASGNFGLGTTAPKTRLQATAGGFLNAPVLGSATGAPLYVTNSDTAYGLLAGVNNASGHVWLQAQRTDGSATAYNLTLNEAGGNVGIGTASPVARLTVVGAATVIGQTSVSARFSDDINSTLLISHPAGTSNAAMITGNNQLAFATGVTGSIAERMRIDASGNVGIGITAPAFKLDVRSGATATAGQFVSTATTAYSAAGYNGGAARLLMYGGNSAGSFTGMQFSHGGNFEAFFGAVQNASNTADFVFQGYSGSAYEERMRINSAGNVGVGTTTPAVTSGKNITIGSVEPSLVLNASSSRSYTIASGGNFQYANNALCFHDNTAGATRMAIDSGGNVGIGTVIPGAYGGKLTVGDAANAFSNNVLLLTRYATFNIAADGVTAANGAVLDVSWASGGQGPLRFSFTGTERMRLTSAGNLGIGTSSPSQRLEVNGITYINTSSAFWEILQLNNTASGAAAFARMSSAAGGNVDIGADATTASTLVFRTAAVERARISAAGGFSVGTTADPGAGAIYATGNITAYYSDDRLKTRLGDIEDALGIVDKIDAFYYEANETAKGLGYEAVREVGVSAQSVQRVLPEVVAPAPIDAEYLTVRYERLVPVLIQAIKELTARVAQLEGK